MDTGVCKMVHLEHSYMLCSCLGSKIDRCVFNAAKAERTRTDTDRETERQRDRQTERQRDRQTDRETERDRQTDRETERDRETDRQTQVAKLTTPLQPIAHSS